MNKNQIISAWINAFTPAHSLGLDLRLWSIPVLWAIVLILASGALPEELVWIAKWDHSNLSTGPGVVFTPFFVPLQSRLLQILFKPNVDAPPVFTKPFNPQALIARSRWSESSSQRFAYRLVSLVSVFGQIVVYCPPTPSKIIHESIQFLLKELGGRIDSRNLGK